MLNLIMPIVIILNFIMLSVIMLNVIMPSIAEPLSTKHSERVEASNSTICLQLLQLERIERSRKQTDRQTKLFAKPKQIKVVVSICLLTTIILSL